MSLVTENSERSLSLILTHTIKMVEMLLIPADSVISRPTVGPIPSSDLERYREFILGVHYQIIFKSKVLLFI